MLVFAEVTEADGGVPGVIWISSVLEIDSGLVTDFTPGKAAFDLFVPALISFSVLSAVIPFAQFLCVAGPFLTFWVLSTIIPSTQLSLVSGPISLSVSFRLLSPSLSLFHIGLYLSFSVLLTVIPFSQLSFVLGPISLSASFRLLSLLLRLIHIEPHLSVCVLLTIIPFVQKISMEGHLRFVVGV
ncbi:Uncharacterised protein [Chlamydia abortus]|nr:Uncharacterised protein [Chlamydia abortus]